MGVIAGLISLIAYVPYISAIVRKRTVPSRTTWWILFSVGMVMFLSYRESGASTTIFFIVGDIAGSFLVAFLSVFYGKDGMRILDVFCFSGAFLSLGLWILFQEYSVIVFFASLSVEIIAMIPTILKTYRNSHEEDATAWTLTFVAAVCNIYAIDTWRFVIVFYPFYEFAINGLIVSLIAFRRKRRVFGGMKCRNRVQRRMLVRQV